MINKQKYIQNHINHLFSYYKSEFKTNQKYVYLSSELIIVYRVNT